MSALNRRGFAGGAIFSDSGTMKKQVRPRYSHEVRDRAVLMVSNIQAEHGSQMGGHRVDCRLDRLLTADVA